METSQLVLEDFRDTLDFAIANEKRQNPNPGPGSFDNGYLLGLRVARKLLAISMS